MYLTPVGEDTMFFCNHCGYAANRQVAKFKKEAPQSEETQPLERVTTPNTTTIESLTQFLNIPKSKTAKVVFYMASFYHQDEHTERLVFAVLRGDMEINETKLMNALKANDLRPASEDEILSSGAVPGYASPVGLKDILVIVDDLIPSCPNLVTGANEPGFHLRNMNYGRDFQANFVADIASAYDSAACENCGKPLFSQRGVEVGNIFKLGTRYSESTGCTFLDENGKEKLILMGSYGIGLGRLLACIAEEHHDVRGLCWPTSVTPYPIYLILIDVKDSTLKEKADELNQKLISLGLEVLYDEREESPGVKFNDADLIGLPVRITLSKKSLDAGGAELKARCRDEKIISPLDQVALRALELLNYRI